MSWPGSSKNPSAAASKPHHRAADPRARLLQELNDNASDNGTFTPIGSRPASSDDSVRSGGGGSAPKRSWLQRATTTTVLAEEAGVKRPWLMYLSYYIPCIAWVQKYQWSFFMGDVAAGSEFSVLFISSGGYRELTAAGDYSYLGEYLYSDGTISFCEFGAPPRDTRPLWVCGTAVRLRATGIMPDDGRGSRGRRVVADGQRHTSDERTSQSGVR